MDLADATRMCDRLFALLTANAPEKLIEMYTDDVFYRDPAKPSGIQGKEPLLRYFQRLLTLNPGWVWKAENVYLIEGGLVVRAKAQILVGNAMIEEAVLILGLIEGGLLKRQEVFFDRSRWLRALEPPRDEVLAVDEALAWTGNV